MLHCRRTYPDAEGKTRLILPFDGKLSSIPRATDLMRRWRHWLTTRLGTEPPRFEVLFAGPHAQ